MPSQPLVSIIIVTYNSAKYISSCLRSVLANAYWPFELIVVDNNSTDSTVKLVNKIKSEYPKVPVILHKSKDNLGYAQGNNLGISLAKGKYFFVLNPDTVVDAHFLIDLVAAAEQNDRIAVVQPAVYLLKNSQQLNLTGKEANYLGFDWIQNYLSSTVPASSEIYSFSGSGFLMVKDLFERVGGFDPLYFMYYEDSDLAWRVKLAGYQIWFVNTSHLYHDYKFEPDESYQSMKQKLFYAERNRIITVLKNYSKKSLLILSPALLLLEVALVFFAILSGWGKQKIDGYRELYFYKNQILTQRRISQNIRKISDRDIYVHLVPTITFSKFNHPILKFGLNPILTLYYKLALFFI